MDRQFFAQLDNNNFVTSVHCVTQEFLDANPERYLGIWVETFFNTDGKTYAGIGFIYNYDTQDFTSPRPNLIADNDEP
jgi:hypothetical protein